MRKKNSRNINNKYLVRQYNHRTESWEEVGKYPSFSKIAEKLNLSRHIVQNIKLGRNKKYKNIFKIILSK